MEPSRKSCPTPVGPEVADASSMPTSSTRCCCMEHPSGAVRRRRGPTSTRLLRYAVRDSQRISTHPTSG
uniref:Uncharacterized protein n=1 Tax=Trichogramma kaykai TaxID=54128 RepID=A0ABD2W8I3_9HYME